MNAWANISVASDDVEIRLINAFEHRLGKIPDHVYKIRELITRHEVCHFKSKRHINKIKDSIQQLEPAVTPEHIGINHIQHGEHAWKKDKTGRSLLGQCCVWALRQWLEEAQSKEKHEGCDRLITENIGQWLGSKGDDKQRLVRLLLARLTWDWKQLEELQRGGPYQELEDQICRMDICHYLFPANLEELICGIGTLTAIDSFEGCGSCDSNIRRFVENELDDLLHQLNSYVSEVRHDRGNQAKVWLTACLMKTLKEQTSLETPGIDLRSY